MSLEVVVKSQETEMINQAPPLIPPTPTLNYLCTCIYNYMKGVGERKKLICRTTGATVTVEEEERLHR